MTILLRGLKNIGSGAENTKTSKKSQALRMTSLLRGLKKSQALWMTKGRAAHPWGVS
jgi:hypothetical protein